MPSSHSTSNNNNNTTTTTTSRSNAAMASLAGFEKLVYRKKQNYRQQKDDEEDATSVCSSVSSLTDDEQENRDHDTTPASTAAAATPIKKKKSKFTITKAATTPLSTASTGRLRSPGTTGSPASDAVSISFLREATPANKAKPTQVIQKALAGLRPGGVFFVLDYRDDSTTAAQAPASATSTTSTAKSPQSCPSRAMKEIPQDLVQQWNLTMVPTNLETYYNTKLKQPTAKPAPPRVSLPASKRIVRWMGIKPARQHQVSPSS